MSWRRCWSAQGCIILVELFGRHPHIVNYLPNQFPCRASSRPLVVIDYSLHTVLGSDIILTLDLHRYSKLCIRRSQSELRTSMTDLVCNAYYSRFLFRGHVPTPSSTSGCHCSESRTRLRTLSISQYASWTILQKFVRCSCYSLVNLRPLWQNLAPCPSQSTPV
ncbi:hypothetical protein K461DRAFT_153332 [Myriangium duriaei CBS 260.36]|uniref:Uncharacterized protein n=1 Tax=Myriangium duriaei CBS 260.36 TaxID=1168546 RepID=A0A9P4J2B8_9PEZI|nr:hypothetical protein K461DRAFT_153332 [Myriangium duriaei CBS 260.36]